MKIVVDTNILFSFFWEKSLTRRLILNSVIELISPEIALNELERYSREIIKKTDLTNKEFRERIKELKTIVKFINKKDYISFLNNAKKISPDKEDIDFLALCMKHSSFLWSNDAVLKNQNKIKVLSTKEVISLYF